MASVRLFVYGSLKRNGRHHDELAGAQFLGEAETEPGYVLTELGEYWGLLAEPASPSVVQGELFEVSDERLPALDDFEGEAYERSRLQVRLGPSQTRAAHSRGFLEALAYFAKAR